MTTLRAAFSLDGPTTTRVAVRSHTLLVDRPAAKGGADRGPLGGEYLLVALGGCLSSHLLAAIRAREASVRDVRIDVSGTLDGSPERFTAFEVAVSADSADPEQLEKLVLIAERACQVVNTLKLAAPVHVTVAGRALATP